MVEAGADPEADAEQPAAVLLEEAMRLLDQVVSKNADAIANSPRWGAAVAAVGGASGWKSPVPYFIVFLVGYLVLLAAGHVLRVWTFQALQVARAPRVAPAEGAARAHRELMWQAVLFLVLTYTLEALRVACAVVLAVPAMSEAVALGTQLAAAVSIHAQNSSVSRGVISP